MRLDKRGSGIDKIGEAGPESWKVEWRATNHKVRMTNETIGTMTKITKTLLIVSVAKLAMGLVLVTGLVNVQAIPGLYVVLPLGAVLFGLFLLSKMLEKETAAFNQEKQALLAAAAVIGRPTSVAAERSCCRIEAERPVTMASS
jgi:hypothetical protein